jgi:uncharacterized protein (TIGR03435 family)
MESLLFEFALRSGLIILTAAVVLRVLRIRVAAAQHAVWVGVLIAMLALPIWISWGPKAPLRLLPARNENAITIPTAAAVADPELTSTSVETPTPISNHGAAQRGFRWSWSFILVGVYLLGACALLLRLTVGTIRANRLTSASCAAPVTVGLLRPRVILPECSSEWPQAQLDAVLIHEREHMRRRDPLVLWLALLNRALFWFHPLAWWLEKRLTMLAEEACDAAVIERGHDAHDYSEYLLDVARAVQRAGTRVNVTAMAMPGSYLTPRIKKIIAGVSSSRVSRVKMAGAVIACAVCSAMFAAGTLDHASRSTPQFRAVEPPRQPTIARDDRSLTVAAPLPASIKKPAPVLIAQATPVAQPVPSAAPVPKFEVASIKMCSNGDDAGGARGGRGGGGGDGPSPDRVNVPCQPLKNIIRMAYITFANGRRNPMDLTPLAGAPSWVDSERYQITAKAEGTPGQDMMRGPMMQALLEERFKLQVRRQTREVPAYMLTVGRGGPKLHPFTEGSCKPFDFSRPPQLPEPGQTPTHACGIRMFREPLDGSPSRWEVYGGKLEDFAKALSFDMDRIVIDKSGITGLFDFKLEFTPDESTPTISALRGRGDAADSPPPSDPSGGLSIFTAIQQQLGLKLEPGKGPREFLAIDRVERPTEN